MGRLYFCKCEVISLWSGDINSNQNSQQLADPYSFTHISHGFLLYGLFHLLFPKRFSIKQKLLFTLLVESAWELFENSDFVINRYRTATISRDYYGDSILNSLGDLLCCLIGFILASKLPTKYSILVVILMEVLLVVWIKDSLFLNVVMLLYPLQLIKDWQR